MNKKNNQLYAEYFGALSNGLRVSIILALRSGRKNVSQLVKLLGADQSAVSHSLKKLISADFVKSKKVGAWRYYSLKTEGVEGLLNAVELHSAITCGCSLHTSGASQYCKMLDTLPIAALIYTNEKVVYANRCALGLYGVRDPKKLIGKKVAQLIDRPSYRRVKPRIQAMMTGNKYPVVIVEKIRRYDGSYFLADVAGTPILFRGRPAIQVIVYPHLDRSIKK